MTRFILLFVLVIVLVDSGNANIDRGTRCNDFQANFDIKDVIGPWYVVALIPYRPDRRLNCTIFKLEFSEVDGAGLKWLLNKTVDHQAEELINTTGIIIRQRYHSVPNDTTPPFDVWSRSIEGVNGCFHQVIALDWSGERKQSKKDYSRHGMMQLHLLEVEGSQPLLLQFLWGEVVSVAIYKKEQGVTDEELKPVKELAKKLLKRDFITEKCDIFLKDLQIF